MILGESQQLYASPEEALRHHGVKGQKWGVRRTNRQFAKSVALDKKAHALEEKSVTKGKLGTRVLQTRARNTKVTAAALKLGVNHTVMTKTNEAAKQDLAALRKRPEFQNINYRDAKGHPRFDVDKFKKLEKADSKIWLGHLNKTVDKYDFDVEIKGNTWELTPKSVEHADDSVLVVHPVRDIHHFLIDVRLDDPKESLQQSFATPEEALKHHGVKGQKWGVRKKEETSGRDAAGQVTKAAPDTPKVLSERQQKRVDKFLKTSDVMGTRIAELKRSNEELHKGTQHPIKILKRSSNNDAIRQSQRQQKQAIRNAEAVKKGKLTRKQKQAIAGAVVVTAIVGYHLYARGQQSGALNSYQLLAKARLRGQKVPFNVNKELSKPMSAESLLMKIAKPVNPGYSTPGGKMNCRRSTYAYELRRRGFDVHATTSAVGWGQSESGVINALTTEGRDYFRATSMSTTVVETGFSSVAKGDKRVAPGAKILLDNLHNTDIFSGSLSSSKKVFDELATHPNGARGEVLFKFGGFGHSMAYEIVDGVPKIFDSQKGTMYDAAHLVESKWDGFTAAEIRRLDNVPLDLNFLTRWTTNV